METVETVEFLVKIGCNPRILLQESLLGNSGINPINLIIRTVFNGLFFRIETFISYVELTLKYKD